MLVQIRRISIRSAFLLATVVYGVIGLLVGVILAAVARIAVPPGTERSLIESLGMWSIVLFPLLYGLLGGLVVAIAAALYNAGASLVGGVKVELPELDGSSAPSWPEEGHEEPR